VLSNAAALCRAHDITEEAAAKRSRSWYGFCVISDSCHRIQPREVSQIKSGPHLAKFTAVVEGASAAKSAPHGSPAEGEQHGQEEAVHLLV
jgi:hypothetical protein